MKTYGISATRVLDVKDCDVDAVVIKDIQSPAEALFTKTRWRSFMSFVDDINEEVKKLKENKTEFRYCQAYGGGWKVSVSSGFWCVDLRQFYLNEEGEEKPTRHGIALRLREWEMLMNTIDRMRIEHPDLFAGIPLCNHDHLLEWLRCPECLPYTHDRRNV